MVDIITKQQTQIKATEEIINSQNKQILELNKFFESKGPKYTVKCESEIEYLVGLVAQVVQKKEEAETEKAPAPSNDGPSAAEHEAALVKLQSEQKAELDALNLTIKKLNEELVALKPKPLSALERMKT